MSDYEESSGSGLWAEATEEETLQHYRTLTNAIDDGIYQLDAEGRFVAVNDVVVDRLGYGREELLGEHVSVLLDDAERVETLVGELLDSEEDTRTVELPVRTADGGRVVCEVRVSLLRVDGEFRGTVGVARDISERKASERRLERRKRELETELGEILGRVSDAFYALDEEYRFTHVNERAEELLQYSGDELLGENLWEAFPEVAEAESVRNAFETAMETQAATDVEFYFEPLDRWFEANVYPSETGVSVYFRDASERKAREKELMQYEALVETINDGIYILDEAGRFELVNDAYAELTGYDREELLGSHASVVVDDEVLRRAERMREEMRDGDATHSVFDATLTTKDGDEVPVEATFAMLPGDGDERSPARSQASPDGRGELRIGVIRDVTRRRKRERALEESERRYRTLIDHFPNGAVGLYDEDLRYTVAGGEIFDSLDASHEELTGVTVYERYPPDIVEEVEPHFRAALAGEANTFEVEYLGRHLFAHTLPVRDADGDVYAGMVVTQDVTERKEQEERLRARERRLERYKQYTDDVLDAVDDIFYIIDRDGNLRRWNESLCAVSGYSDDEIRSMHALEFFDADADRPDAVANAIQRGFETGHTRVQANILTKDGDSVPYEFYGASLEDPDGDPVVAGIGRNITERKEAQRRLEESNERLEQFAYAASHDLQEPLRMVSSYLSLVDRRYRDELDDDGREFIAYAVDGAERMREMIDALLTYSRVEMRGDEFEPVDLETLIEDVRKNLELKIEETEAEVTVESLPRVHGDRGQLRQVLQNLLSNALEYHGDGPPRVRVSADRRGSEWEIAVRDEGIGIDPAHTDRIFEVFQRLHTSDDHAGTGIGLALCQRIVERHGGEIWVDSELGEGATFRFTVPAAEGRHA